jgi:hypothetical protein
MIQTLIRSSDGELVRRIREALAATGRPDLTRLLVESTAGLITLSGTTSCWYARQLALHCVLQNAQSVEVHDAIQVVSNR